MTTTINPISQRLAARMDREQSQLARIGTQSAARLGTRARVAAIHAYRNGRDVQAAIRAALAPMHTIVADGMVTAHLQGMLRSHREAGTDTGIEFGAFSSVLNFIKRKLDMTRDDIRAVQDTYGKAAASATGDALSGLEVKVNRALLTATQDRLHTQAGIQAIRNAFDAAGVVPDSESSLETLYRTETAKAYGAGRWQADQSNAIQEILWGYEFLTVGDDRVRETHAAMEGTRAAKDDPIWRKWFPPCGYNCRCQAIPIYIDDPDLASVNKPDNIPEPDLGFGVNFGEVFRVAA